MIVNHQVRVIRLFSKALVGLQLNWSAREKECYGIYYGVKLFEDLLDNRCFIFKTDHMNLTYINVTFTGKALRWKMYLQIRTSSYTLSLERLCVNHVPPPPTLAGKSIVALCPVMDLPQEVYDRLTDIHNSLRGHVGLKKIRKQRVEDNLEPDAVIPERMISEYLRQCPYCQITNRLRLPIKAHRFTFASYNPFEVLHLDHIGPLTKDAHGNEFILVIIDTFSRWVELFPTKSTTAVETASVVLNHIGRFGNPEVKDLLFIMS